MKHTNHPPCRRQRRPAWVRVRGSGIRLVLLACSLAALGTTAPPATATESGNAVSKHLPPDLPEPVSSFGAVSVGDDLYVFGGHLGRAHAFSLANTSGAFHRWRWGSDEQQWQALPPQEPAQSPGLATWQGRVYLVGGLLARNAPDEDNDLVSLARALVFDPEADRWQALPDLPAGRSSHDVVVHQGRLFALAGWNMGGRDGRTQWHGRSVMLDLEQAEAGGEWVEFDQPFRSRGFQAAVWRDQIWLLGGMDQANETSATLWRLDPETLTWHEGSELPTEAPFHAFGAGLTATDDALLAVIGDGEVWRLTDPQGEWQSMGELEQPRLFPRLVHSPDGRVLVLGGSVMAAGTVDSVEWLPGHGAGSDKATGHEPAAEGHSATAAADDQAATGDDQGRLWWPDYRGPARDGVVPDDMDELTWPEQWPAAGPEVRWSAELGSGLSGLTVAGERVIGSGHVDGRDLVRALDLDTGAVLWEFGHETPASPHPMPIVPPGPASTPVVDGGQVFSLSREGRLHVLSLDDGELLWSTHLVEDHGGERPVYGYAGTPWVGAEQVFIEGGGGASNLLLDRHSGEVVWRTGDRPAGYASARAIEHEGRPALVVFKGNALVVLDMTDGSELAAWPWQTTDYCNCATPLVTGDGRFFIGSTNDRGAAMVGWDGDGEAVVHWQVPRPALLFNSATAWGDQLIGFHDRTRGASGILVALDKDTGAERWTFEELERGTFVRHGDRLLVLTASGELANLTLQQDGVTETARAQVLPARCWVAPALAPGAVIVRNNDGRAVCLQW